MQCTERRTVSNSRGKQVSINKLINIIVVDILNDDIFLTQRAEQHQKNYFAMAKQKQEMTQQNRKQFTAMVSKKNELADELQQSTSREKTLRDNLSTTSSQRDRVKATFVYVLFCVYIIISFMCINFIFLCDHTGCTIWKKY